MSKTLTHAVLAFEAAYRAAFDAALEEMVSIGPGHKEGRNVARSVLREWQEKLEALEAHLGADPIIASTFRTVTQPRLEEELSHVYETGRLVDWAAAE